MSDELWRLEHLEILQENFKSFTDDFLPVAMNFMGFDTTELQKDIAAFMEHGPSSIMVQACRGIAKTTVAGLYGVFTLIHNPNARIVIVTAGQDFAEEISTMIIRIITDMPELECLRPDVRAGDRSSVKAFDINHTLRRIEKGAEKAPSVKCVGIGGIITGSRADLLISDDIEVPKNSETAAMREKLLRLSNEFSDVSVGRIMYLGTPQSIDSIYNSLPGRGFTVRIWPGRYPTPDQRKWYGEYLAPMLVQKLEKDPSLGTGGGMARDQGQPTDTRIGEDTLRRKELEKGSAAFQLQYMLNTRLSDAERYPLKTSSLVFDRLDGDLFPTVLSRDPRESGLRKLESAGHSFMVSARLDVPETDIAGNTVGPAMAHLNDSIMYIDPAGGGTISKDETAFAHVGLLNSNLYVIDAGGIPGGYDGGNLERLAKIVAENNPNRLFIEKNYGNGAFKEVFLPILRKYWIGDVQDHMVHGQKEVRINGTLGPVMGRGALCITQKAVDSDSRYCDNYSAEVRKLYSLFFQMEKLTLDKGSLAHDDRLDALAGAVSLFVPHLVVDQETASRKAREAELLEFFKNPTGRRIHTRPARKGSILNKYFR